MGNPRACFFLLLEDEMDWLDCACCGRSFKGWQHPSRDTGYGICDDVECSTAYGYHTVGPKPSKEDYAKLVKEIACLRNQASASV